MDDYTTSYNGLRRLHVGEDYYDRRLREKREQEAKRKAQEAKQKALEAKQKARQAGTAAQWQAWFADHFRHFELNGGTDDLLQAIGEELAERDRQIRAAEAKNAALEKRVEKLEQMLAAKTAVDQQVEEITKRLDARALARDESKRGDKGEPGAPGAPGKRGPRGEKGDKGDAAKPVYIVSWQLDRERYRLSPLYSDGTVGPQLELRALFEQFCLDRG